MPAVEAENKAYDIDPSGEIYLLLHSRDQLMDLRKKSHILGIIFSGNIALRGDHHVNLLFNIQNRGLVGVISHSAIQKILINLFLEKR